MTDPNQGAFAGGYGMTKREYFSALAMQGLLFHMEYGGSAESVAQRAVREADALIAELNRASREVEGTQTA